MQVSLKLMLILVGCLSVMIGSVWPYFEQEYNRLSVQSPKRMLGSRLGWVETADAYSKSGRPTLIFGDASIDSIGYFKRHHLPWLVVANQPSRTRIPVTSKVTLDGSNLYVHSKFQLDQFWCWFTYQVEEPVDQFGDPVLWAPAVESMILNGEKLSVAKGRVVELDLVDGELHIKQHDITAIPGSKFRTAHLDDRERIDTSLRWWERQKRLSKR